MAAPALASVFNMFERQERSACAQMAAIIWTRRSHREKKQINPSFSVHLSFLSNYWVWAGGWWASYRLYSDGFIRPHPAFWQ